MHIVGFGKSVTGPRPHRPAVLTSLAFVAIVVGLHLLPMTAEAVLRGVTNSGPVNPLRGTSTSVMITAAHSVTTVDETVFSEDVQFSIPGFSEPAGVKVTL